MRYLFVFAAFTVCHCSASLTTSVSGYISRSTHFFYKKFPVPPSKWAIVKVDVSYIKEKSNLIMAFYATRNHINITYGCIDRTYQQTGNKNLYPELTTNSNLSGPLTCKLKDVLRCTGEIPIQDYTPRSFSFSFGFPCDQIQKTDSLQGLHYALTIQVTNELTCSKLPASHTCHSYTQYGAVPNLIDRGQTFFHFEPIPSCLQLLELAKKFVCYFLIPVCDPESNQIIRPCKEMCYNYLDACALPSRHEEYINCDYLPSLNGNVPCLYAYTEKSIMEYNRKCNYDQVQTIFIAVLVCYGWSNTPHTI